MALTPQALFDVKMAQAMYADSFRPLIAYPKLLHMWQRSHQRDMRRIGAIAGHRIGGHDLCEENCLKIDRWTKRTLISQITEILNFKVQPKRWG